MLRTAYEGVAKDAELASNDKLRRWSLGCAYGIRECLIALDIIRREKATILGRFHQPTEEEDPPAEPTGFAI